MSRVERSHPGAAGEVRDAFTPACPPRPNLARPHPASYSAPVACSLDSLGRLLDPMAIDAEVYRRLDDLGFDCSVERSV